MKRYTSIFLLIAIVLSLMSPVYATPRASIIFTKSSASLAESSGDLIITVYVGASSILDEIGASSVELQQKINGRWTTVCTFTPSQYSNLMTTSATFLRTSVTYDNPTSNNQYRAYVTFYGRSGNVSDEITTYSTTYTT